MRAPLKRAKGLPALAGIVLSAALGLGESSTGVANASPTPLKVAATNPPAAVVPTVTMRFMPAVGSRCDAAAAGSSAYNYPVKPFRQQHPIRGYLGDPRTQALRNGNYTPSGPGPFNLHHGVDIVAATGTAVYPVVSGIAYLSSEYVGVRTADGREFRYYHIRPSVGSGQRVSASTTVLGRTLPHFNHVHLSEIISGVAHNPLDPGHLTPYRDRTVPVVEALRFTSSSGAAMNPLRLRGSVAIAAEAYDMPALPIVGDWPGLGVTPALVQWSLRAADGRVVIPWQTTRDFRLTQPSDHDYWRVFGPGTHQNKYGENYPLKILIVGEYFSNLTPSGSLDTRGLANGEYLLSVKVADTCGNAGMLSQGIAIVN